MVRSLARDISLEMCSKTYRPLAVLSLIAVVFVVLTTPFTRKATTAIIRMQATSSVTIISTIVNAFLDGSCRTAPLSPPVFSSGDVMGQTGPR
jgi:hypothetical protein